MWTLKRAMEACERVEKMPRNRWAKADRALTIIAGVLALALIFWRVNDTAYGDSYDEPPLPYIGTEMLGGERGSEWCARSLDAARRARVLCRRNAVCGNDRHLDAVQHGA